MCKSPAYPETMSRPFRAGINFVASFVGNFVAFLESWKVSGWSKCAV